MKRAAGIAAALALMLIAPLLVFGACGDDSDGGQTVERTTCRPATPITPQPSGDLPEGFKEYQSPERAYRAKYPEAWEVEPNGVSVQNIAGDIFYAPEAQGDVKPNISVSCETVPIGTTTQQFFDAKSEVIERIVGVRPGLERTLTLDGKEGFVVEYPVVKERTPEPVQIDKIEVFFADDLGGWTIALVVPQGTLEQYRPLFDDFLTSFDRY
ncbi:MAG: hypothetical protein QME71_08120 [Dehalococcoidia bacterium]|nr:hypothetical protein [Dehalococcoidia bacterium]